MKKTLFLAALAVVAMAACTKNELKVPSKGTDAEISFQPVVANATKASYITNESIAPTGTPKSSDFKFSVFAWYTKDDMTVSTTESVATAYMSNVEVSYNAGIDDGTTTGSGAWAPSTKYYWPKNGKLSFDAYAPSTALADATEIKSDVTKGLQINGYTVANLDKQYDLLFSTRVKNQVSSTAGANTDYDGVDIAFKHALSAIEVKAKTADNYGEDVVKLKKVTIQNAYNKGSFSQNMTNPVTEATTPGAWSSHDNEVDYVLFDVADGVGLTTTEITSSHASLNNAILLPQNYNHGSNTVSIKVDYAIKHGSSYLDQTQTFVLSGTYTGSGAENLSAWLIGHRYTYTLVFTLEEVYFAPTVEVWKDIAVDQIDVK